MSDGYSARPMGALRVSLLGSFRASVGDAALAAGGAKQRAVLAMLALRAGETVPESRLIDGIWGDETPSAVRSSLQVYVAHWRRVLAEAGCAERIERVGAGYRLEMERADVDVNRYASLVALARAALGEERYVVAAGRFDEAQALWRGDALQDFVGMPFHQWETVSLESARVQALADRTDALLGSGRGSELVAGLEGLVAQHPYEERFRAQLMHALYRSGRQVDAVRVVEQARSALLEVGIEVGPLLRAMEQRVLQQDPTLDSTVSPFAPAAPPEPITSMVGRDDDVVALVHQVSRGGERLVTLTGPGGVGKSRLALEVANRVLEEGWMPVAYLALAEATDASVVASMVNGAFGVPESWRERPVVEIAKMLGGNPLLVVIDGAEHVHEAVRSAVGELLQHGRQLHVLVTSRVVLGLHGERQVSLGPLSFTSPTEERLRHAPAVALFIERAERFQSGLQYEDEDIRLIAEICEGVDGLPLAIELAAARSSTLGVEGLRRRLGSRLDVLAAPHLVGERRHRSLREVIAWSHDLLTPAAQALFARLSVLPGGFEVEQVERMWATDGPSTAALESFEELDRHSLLTRTHGRGTPRFGMLDTVREYAGERLDERGETIDANRRLIRWVHELIEATGGRMGAGASQFDHLEHEVGNVRAAVAWALEHESGDTAAELCTKLYPWWMMRARGEELGRWLTSSDISGITRSDLGSRCSLFIGRIHGRKDRIEQSNHYLEMSLKEFRRALDSDGVVHATSSLVENLVHQRRFSEAATLASEGVRTSANSRDAEVRCRALHAACWLAGSVGDLDSSRRMAEELVRDARAAGLVEFEAKTLADLAWMNRASGEHEAALGCATLAVERALEAGTGGSVVSAFTELSLASLVVGDLQAGVRAVTKALSFESGDDLSPSSILRLALAMSVLGDRLSDSNLVRIAADLVATVRSVDVSAEVWPADEKLVGATFRSVAASVPPVRQVVTDVDAINHARAVGKWLHDNWSRWSDDPPKV